MKKGMVIDMIIHVVQEGDTIVSIADQYQISVTRLIQDNGLERTNELVIGQTIVIAHPQKTYTVQEGDTLQKIADINGISLIQLLRNNPFLTQREYIYPGETIVISYDTSKGIITTNGFANAFIDKRTLEITLPFLSYISVFGYETVGNADILELEDTEIIRLTKEYKVTPILMFATLTIRGIESYEAAFRVLYDKQLVEKHIDHILNILHSKGYEGVNISYRYITEENLQLFEYYTQRLVTRLKQEGFLVFITFSEEFVVIEDRITFEKIDLSNISNMVDGITVLNYNFGYSFGPPGPITSTRMMKEFLDYITQYIPPEKIELGIPIIGYDWELPYVIGLTKAHSLTLNSALLLASNVGATIQFDEASQTPYFNYIDESEGIPRNHVVWFFDARSIDSILDLVTDYGLRGVGIWNIMDYCPQIWLVMSSQYEIKTLNS